MIAVHHSLLCRLQQVVPSSDYAPVMQRGKGHMRWYSIDGAVPTRKRLGSLRQERRSLDTSRSSSGNGEPHLLCDPSVVLAVTTIFDEHIAKFSAYDDFGEQYELVRFAVEQAQQSTACWWVSDGYHTRRLLAKEITGPSTTLPSRRLHTPSIQCRVATRIDEKHSPSKICSSSPSRDCRDTSCYSMICKS